PSFGAPDDGLGFAPTTIQHSHGSTAICGIQVLDDPSWPEEFQGNLIIGNVMTSRINRDRVEWRGSTSVGHEAPDFLTVTDPWFRPVDLQLGPDGALWVADFYNRIIGHYEVPLTHPLRDRERGRIWRIVPPKGADLARLKLDDDSLESLINEFASPNRARRTLALNRLVDLHKNDGVRDRLGKLLTERDLANPQQRVHTLWAWSRMNRDLHAGDSEVLFVTGRDPDPMVRTHLLRLLVAGSTWDNEPEPLRKLVLESLWDVNAHVRRAAAEALANSEHQSAHASEYVRALLDALAKAPKDDTHLRHALRISLRNNLAVEGGFTQISLDNLTESDARTLADIAPAVTNSAAASFLVAHLQKYPEPREVAAKYLKHAARFLPKDRIDDLAGLAQEKFRDDVDLQSALFKSVQDGLAQRGVALSARMKSWGSALAADLLAVVARTDSDWISMPTDSNSTSPNPWAVQRRKSSDGKEADFLCTLPAGEQMTGVLRSKKFTAPAGLTFWMAGHDGFPEKPLQKKNLVRLRKADSLEVLFVAPAPRNDVAKEISWDLG
ncbi:MAG TPA: hypothetical protein VGF13_18605, partial [Verrucomicrobiae bacterium]